MLGRNFRNSWQLLRPHDELIAVARSDCDLTDIQSVRSLLHNVRPNTVIHTASKVAGIVEKLDHPMHFLLQNNIIDANTIQAALDAGVGEFLYISSAAAYPAKKEAVFQEDDLLSGKLETANEPYALAKISGMKLCQYASKEFGVSYRSVLPSNLYGPHDHFLSQHPHLIASALRKLHDAVVNNAATVSVWGDGTARREFTYAPDVTDWLVTQIGHLQDWPSWVNLGCGDDYSVSEYYTLVSEIVGYSGDFYFDTSKPVGVQRRLLNSAVARDMGWSSKTSIDEGLVQTYSHMLSQIEKSDLK
ncbi:NAD-dependent epimerase/dehydratase [Arthrobacter crystallopoietes BAB-32]|uniref:NAD-dependent epimerase/dehydratase n=2 Tax=Crystallibacter crystallopoietes TaxID=37928 RepID=N1VCT6_9MICC|nr:NAD-dependent epimerase/dehydratase [Arthrobacter crystallopoietes BAB-32]